MRFAIFFITALLCGTVGPLATADDIADEQWRREELPDLQLTVELPSSWTIELSANQAGAILTSPNEQCWPVEIVSWLTTASKPSPAEGAAGHERLLGERWSYSRLRTEGLVTGAGEESLLTIGEVTGPDGIAEAALFAVFNRGQRYYLVGTFCDPDSVAQVRQAYFDRISSSVEFLTGEETQPEPTEPILATSPSGHRETIPVATGTHPSGHPPEQARPTTTPEQPQPVQPLPVLAASPQRPGETMPVATGAHPSGQVPQQPQVTTPERGEPAPVAPASPPPQPEPAEARPTWRRVALAGKGISFAMPERWEPGRIDDVVTITAPDNTAAACFWPVLGDGVSVEDIIGAWAERMGVSFTELRRREDGGCVVVSGLADDDQSVCAVSLGQQCHLLTAIIASLEGLGAHHEELCAILASFQGGPWSLAVQHAPLPQGSTTWTEPELGALRLVLPAGWQAQGGVHRYNGRLAIDIDAQGPVDSGRLRVVWRQPHTPAFRELTPLLRGMGWKEGQQYRATPREDYLRVLSRGTLSQFITDYLLALPSERWETARIVEQGPLPAAEALARGEERQGELITVGLDTGRGRLLRSYAIGSAELPISEGSYRWQVGYLAWEAEAGHEQRAQEALGFIVGNATVTQHWPARGTERVELQAALLAARSCVAALSGVTAQGEGIVGVLSKLAPAGAGGAQVTVPAGALELWERRHLLQLGGEWWQ